MDHKLVSGFQIAARKKAAIDDLERIGSCFQASVSPSGKRNPLREKIRNYKGIIFDMDGTLVDSMWMWKEIDREYLKRFSIELPKDLQGQIEGMSFSETAVFFKEYFGIKDSLDTIKKTWNEMACDKYRRKVPFKEGALDFLKHCKGSGIKLGIATSNSRELVEHVAEALSFYDYFDCIMTACEVNRGKPSPDIYLAVADRLKLEPKDCLVFEDIIPGIQAGKAAGMCVCSVEDEYSENTRKEKEKLADYYILDYRELL